MSLVTMTVFGVTKIRPLETSIKQAEAGFDNDLTVRVKSHDSPCFYRVASFSNRGVRCNSGSLLSDYVRHDRIDAIKIER